MSCLVLSTPCHFCLAVFASNFFVLHFYHSEIARRGKFTWRDSFGVYYDPFDTYNKTWTEILLWGVDTYDIVIDWWAQTLDRMNMGVSFLQEWQDSSIILITKEGKEDISDEIKFWNWLRPYDYRVWALTVFTILLSGFVYQWLEWFADERDDRTMWEWWLENFYLSAINFTQAYEYSPKTLSARLFGISMAIWALVMTATYTANLASLLVDRKEEEAKIETIEQIAVFHKTICTYEGTFSDTLIADQYPSVRRFPKSTPEGVYEGLNSGECDYAADTVSSWLKLKLKREYNSLCDLEWVGGDKIVRKATAGFVVGSKGKSPGLCSSLIRNVIDFHIQDLITDGFLDDAWDRENKRSQNIDCDSFRPELADNPGSKDNPRKTRHLLQNEAAATNCQRNVRAASVSRRRLKGASGAAAASAAVAAGGGESTKLTLNQMIGTFAFHWIMMAVAVAIAAINNMYQKYVAKKVIKKVKKIKKSISGRIRKNCSKGEFQNDVETSVMKSETSPGYICGGAALESSTSDRDGIMKDISGDESSAALQREVAALRGVVTQVLEEQREGADMREIVRALLNEQRELRREIQSLTGASLRLPLEAKEDSYRFTRVTSS